MIHAVYEMIFFGPTTYVVAFCSLLLIFLVKFTIARRHYYKRRHGLIPKYPHKEYTVTSLVTYAGEEASFFEQALRSLRALTGLKSHKIYILMDGMGDITPNDEASLRAAEKYATRIWLGNYKKKRFNLWFMTSEAEAAGDDAEIMHLMDSDTFFPKTDVGYLMTQPFADPKMGGGTTAQRAHLRTTSAMRTGDLLEHARIGLSLAASNETRGIPCLPGRSIWLRWLAAAKHMLGLNSEYWGMWVPSWNTNFPFIFKWIRVECYAGDDRYLTDRIHFDKWDSFFNPDAGVETLLGETRSKMYKQWWRWCTTSQGNTYRNARSLWRNKPFALLYHLSDTYSAFVAAFLMWSWLFSVLFSNGEVFWPLSLILASSFVSMSSMLIAKNYVYFKKYPKDLLSVPLFLLDIAVGVHIRIFANFTQWRVKTWGTRSGVDDKTEIKFVREHHWKH